MCETTGSAAAPAARCRKVLRGSLMMFSRSRSVPLYIHDPGTSPSSSLRGLVEKPQVRWRLVFLGRHQETVRAQKIVFAADDDIGVIFGANGFRPLRAQIGVANISF